MLRKQIKRKEFVLKIYFYYSKVGSHKYIRMYFINTNANTKKTTKSPEMTVLCILHLIYLDFNLKPSIRVSN